MITFYYQHSGDAKKLYLAQYSAVCEDAPQNSQIKFDFATQFLNLGNSVKE